MLKLPIKILSYKISNYVLIFYERCVKIETEQKFGILK